jgi:D-sedoheptulose 7-phosphate isomerase
MDIEWIQKIQEIIKESTTVINRIEDISEGIIGAINQIVDCISNGGKIVIFGNGGSAADAQHIAAELIGRFVLERKSYPAIALTTDTSALTAIGNDYSFNDVFSRQCDGLVNKKDVVIGISTSGNSENVRKGLEISKNRGAFTIGLLGNDGGKIKDVTDINIIVNSKSTARIQESHRIIYHIICQLVEEKLTKMEQL